ncbi:MAG: hypothetical protein ABI597_02655 [Gammaproteobacteria bacterium]
MIKQFHFRHQLIMLIIAVITQNSFATTPKGINACSIPEYSQCVCTIDQPCSVKISAMISKILYISNIPKGKLYTCSFDNIQCSAGMDVTKLVYENITGTKNINVIFQNPNQSLVSNKLTIDSKLSSLDTNGIIGGNLTNNNALPPNGNSCSFELRCV